MYRNDQGHQKRHTPRHDPADGTVRGATRPLAPRCSTSRSRRPIPRRPNGRGDRPRTFEQLADRYVEEWARPQKRSWRDDARQLRTMCLPRWKTRAVDDITHDDIRQLLSGDRQETEWVLLPTASGRCSPKCFGGRTAPPWSPDRHAWPKEITRDRERDLMRSERSGNGLPTKRLTARCYRRLRSGCGCGSSPVSVVD